MTLLSDSRGKGLRKHTSGYPELKEIIKNILTWLDQIQGPGGVLGPVRVHNVQSHGGVHVQTLVLSCSVLDYCTPIPVGPAHPVSGTGD